MSIEEVRAQIDSGISNLNEAPVDQAASEWGTVHSQVVGVMENITRAMEIAANISGVALPAAMGASSQVAGKADTALGEFTRAAEGARANPPDEMLAATNLLKTSGEQQVNTGQNIQQELGAIASALASVEQSIGNLEQLNNIAHGAAEKGPEDRGLAVSKAEEFRDRL